MKKTESFWQPDKQLLVTYISGDADSEDVARWKKSLEDALHQMPDKSSFKIFVNLHGFKAFNLAAHKQFREIIPRTLAGYGHKVGYIDLFEEAEVQLQNLRGISCIAAVHVHHDVEKIGKYDRLFGRHNERFFTDPVAGQEWIEKFAIN